MKCKVINTNKVELEDNVNKWLNTGKYEIFKIVQSQVDTYITLTILYYDKRESRAKKLEILNKISKNR